MGRERVRVAAYVRRGMRRRRSRAWRWCMVCDLAGFWWVVVEVRLQVQGEQGWAEEAARENSMSFTTSLS